MLSRRFALAAVVAMVGVGLAPSSVSSRLSPAPVRTTALAVGERGAAAIPGRYIVRLKDDPRPNLMGRRDLAQGLAKAHHGTLGDVWSARYAASRSA
jgi:hypothetical protein